MRKKLLVLTILELIFILLLGVVSGVALGSNPHFFIPELFGPQMGIAVFLLSVPITGFIAVAQGNAEFAFWHALFSASGIAVSLTGAILAAYGTAIGKALKEYYLGIGNNTTAFGTTDTYESWIMAAPVICMISCIMITILLPFSYFSVVNASKTYPMNNQLIN